ncbi:MAG: transcriptional repressor [Pseudomonadota bacterium]
MARTTRNTDLVLEKLRASDRALTAYQLLDRLRDEGLSGPPSIYRALARLIESGDVHRIESLNAFAACGHSACTSPVFALCVEGDRAIELVPPMRLEDIDLGAGAVNFEVSRAVIELQGICETCRRAHEENAPQP